MLPPYIIDKNRDGYQEQQIQLEIPDYRLEYEEWLKKKNDQDSNKQDETVIIIDIY